MDQNHMCTNRFLLIITNTDIGHFFPVKVHLVLFFSHYEQETVLNQVTCNNYVITPDELPSLGLSSLE